MKTYLKELLSAFALMFLLDCSTEPEAPQETTAKLLHADLIDDEQNCGATGYVCVHGRQCNNYRCTPAWQEIEDSGRPTLRHSAAAGTVAGKYVVFGGCATTSGNYPALTSSGIYDPETDTWQAGPPLASARCAMAATSTPLGVFTFGGLFSCENGTAIGPSLEGMFDIGAGWTPITAPDEITLRYNTGLTWTTDGLFVYGGGNTEFGDLNNGGLVTLGAAWQHTTCSEEACGRGGHYLLFTTGDNIHVLGGGLLGPVDGLQYVPATDTWTFWDEPVSEPDYNVDIAPVSTQADDGQRIYRMGTDASIRIYDRITNTWAADYATQPSGLCHRGAASWVSNEYIIWSGGCDGLSAVGARYQPPAPGVSP